METKDIKKLWTIKNGEAAETWVKLDDVIQFIEDDREKVDQYYKELGFTRELHYRTYASWLIATFEELLE